MTSFTPEQMQQVLAEYKSGRAALEHECNAAVVQWRMATEQMWSPLPLYDQVDRGLEWCHGWRIPKRKWLKPNSKAKWPKKHGFDQSGRLRIYDDTFYYVYSNDWIDEISFFPDQTNVIRYVPARGPGQIVESFYVQEHSGSLHFTHERFDWDGEHLVRSVQSPQSFEGGRFAEPTKTRVYHYEYEASGLLTRVVRELCNEAGPFLSTVVFFRPAKLSLDQAAKEIEDFLVAHIPKAISEIRPAHPIYAVLLSYCGEDITAGWPGGLVLASDKHRQGVLQSASREDWLYKLWWPGEVADGDGGGRSEPAEKAAIPELQQRTLQYLQLAQDTQEFDYDELRRLLCRVARRLNERDWARTISVTDDFIVAPVDGTGDCDFDVDLRESVPSEKLELLRSRELIVPPS
jgi:hypothetical protein